MGETDEGSCEEREDGIHCHCWWEGESCCACGAIAMTNEEMTEQGMVVE